MEEQNSKNGKKNKNNNFCFSLYIDSQQSFAVYIDNLFKIIKQNIDKKGK